MWEILRGQDVVAIVIACSFGVAFVAAKAIGAWRNREEHRLAAELKLEMISRGMSADEIERVLNAKLTTRSADGTREFAQV